MRDWWLIFVGYLWSPFGVDILEHWRSNITIWRKLRVTASAELGLEDWFSLLVPHYLNNEMEVILSCVTLRLYLSKGVFSGHLQWDSIRKSPTEWAELYGVGSLVMGDTIYLTDGNKFTETACLMCGLWFGKFMIGSKFWMVLIKKQEFWVTIKIKKTLMVEWYTYW